MTTNLHVNDRFPDIALPNHESELTQLSHFTKPGLLDTQLGFLDGYPLILAFFRGFFGCTEIRYRQIITSDLSRSAKV